MEINLKPIRGDIPLIHAVAARAKLLLPKPKRDMLDWVLDFTATHLNGCPMNFEKLLAADDFSTSSTTRPASASTPEPRDGSARRPLLAEVPRMKLYMLEGKKAVRCSSVKQWGDSFEQPPGALVKLDLVDKGAGIRVSTIFLGIDLSYGQGTEPILFETMVFDKRGVAKRWPVRRCSTYEQAEAQHAEIVAMVKRELA